MARLSFSNSFPSKKTFYTVIGSFSKKQWIMFLVLAVILVISALAILANINNRFIVKTPGYGGKMTEGIIGTPRFVNPLLAISDADRDLSTLVYSGLMRRMPDGTIIPDLAESYSVSDDGLTYTFILKPDVTFHDGTKVTVDDVLYTIQTAQDSLIKSPKKVNWDGIAVEKKDDRTIAFTLKQRYATFLENTTLGILPAKVWKSLSPEQFSLSNLNIKGAGSGPYIIKNVRTSSSGIPSSYDLVSFKKFALGEPYIKKITIKFYANEKDLVDAYKGGSVDNISEISPSIAEELAKSGYDIKTTSLPRIFGLFFNPNQAPIFTDVNVTRAFNTAINKDRIIKEVLSGYGEAIDSPIPPHLLQTTELSSEATVLHTGNIDTAKDILVKDGWTAGADGILEKKKDKKTTTRLSFSIATSDTPELKNAAHFIEEDLEKIGAEVDVKIFETGTLNQDIIRPRKYDAVFFGQIVSHETDLFAFWHSSQRNDPGLNIAEYTSAAADKLLTDAAGMLDTEKRTNAYLAFAAQVEKDMPAVFIYSPDFIYPVNKDIKGIVLDRITIPSDRFLAVYTWYRTTEKLWKVFLSDDAAIIH